MEERSVSVEDQLQVWFDGGCALCQRSRSWCETEDDNQRLRFVDYRHVTEGELPVSRHRLEAAMWVRTNEGELFAGFDGWLRILSELPRWRWLARVCGVPPLRWLGPPVYLLVARWRHRLPLIARDQN
jgi:predicted DCC family thiol-disulfide oxidoreductase YuxK